MIKKLEIEYFQAHKNTVMNFHKGVNVIIGDTDAAKSSIIRAIKWVVKNTSGFWFRSTFSKRGSVTRVRVTVPEGVVERRRGKKINQYWTSKHGKLEAMRADVPEEVGGILRIDGDTSIRGQHDRYFLLQDTPGEVARKLNEVAGLDVIDKVLSSLKSKHKKSKDALIITNQELQETKDDLKRLKSLDKLNNMLTRVERNVRLREREHEERSELARIIREISRVDREIAACKDWITVSEIVEPIKDEIAELQKLADEREEISSLVKRIEKIDRNVDRLNDLISFEVMIKKIVEEARSIEVEKQDRFEIQTLIDAIERKDDEIATAANSLIDSTREYKEFLEENEICPLAPVECPIMKEVIKKIDKESSFTFDG